MPRSLAAAIDELLARRQRWPDIRQQARRFVEVERTWATSVARYREVYRRALARHGRSPSI
jgi:glycogen(starch) synthase